jgi:tetratricopeptide (TPR) repeat protein
MLVRISTWLRTFLWETEDVAMRELTGTIRAVATCLLLVAGSTPSVAAAAPGTLPSEERFSAEERLSAEERELIDLDRRRGKIRQVLDDLDELLEEVPGDFLARTLRAAARFDTCAYEGALADARRALADAGDAEETTPQELAHCARELARLLVEFGRPVEAVEILGDAGGALSVETDPRDAWALGSAQLASGDREAALETLRAGAEARGPRTWRALLDQARCQRVLGRIRPAAKTLVAADELASDGYGVEPDVLVLLGDVYFEAYGEVDDALSRAHSPAELYREALRLHPEHEGARLGLFELYRFNWRRSRVSPGEILEEVFAARPRSIDGLLARASAAIDDGDLRTARRSLNQLNEIAPGRRDVRTQRASLSWIEHRRGRAEKLLEKLVTEDPGDARPEHEVGRHLLELYRFAEALPFLERAAQRDARDWRTWTDLGRAQANTGDEDEARASLRRATDLADGRRDAWRDNTLLVLERMHDTMMEHEEEELSFLWHADAGPVYERYLVPFYEEAREELAQRYGFTPGPVKIEVFRRWGDFSVRSTGFEGYPALGVCFGPVVTAVSPLSELRGNFSWARTSYHEFTHVIHLGLSHNRCPRWVTEGLATWEEGQRNPAWWRNLRREMLDARANDDVIPIRRLNAAFRGPRVVFAYYEGGLLCKMLIEEHGFAPMVRLLEAFDEGADLDQALERVFEKTPEELDAAFATFVDRELGDLRLEPRWSQGNTFRRRFRLSRTPPEDAAERTAWIDEWCRVGWGSYWTRELVDAKEALRLAGTAGDLPPRGLFLRGELAVAAGDLDEAKSAFRRGFELGGEDYRARMALAAILVRETELVEAETHFLAAEEAFPGYDDARFSAELRLADLYRVQGREDEANEARLRWLAWNAGDFEVRAQVAEWLGQEERFEEAARLWQEANEVDPFRRHLHLAWGQALRSLGRHEEALREFEVGLLIPEELDGDVLLARGLGALAMQVGGEDRLLELAGGDASGRPSADDLLERWRAEEPLLHGYRALTLLDLERAEEARASVTAALELDPECAPALEAQARL